MIISIVVFDVIELCEKTGWVLKSKEIASTGSTYLDIYRTCGEEKEWIVIRIADHKMVYDGWLNTYSISPGNLFFDELEEILTKPFGKVGDIL